MLFPVLYSPIEKNIENNLNGQLQVMVGRVAYAPSLNHLTASVCSRFFIEQCLDKGEEQRNLNSCTCMNTMGRMLKLFLPYPVSLNRLYRVFRGKIVPSAEATRWGKQVRFIASQKPVEVTKDNIRMEVAIHPKLTVTGLPSKVLVDIDAPLKKLFDSLEGLVYENDKQIKKLYVYYAEPIINGGLTVNIDKDE